MKKPMPLVSQEALAAYEVIRREIVCNYYNYSMSHPKDKEPGKYLHRVMHDGLNFGQALKGEFV